MCRPSPDADACTAHGAGTDCNFCAAQIEIDRINVRPDGLEVVIEDDIDLDVNPQDPQASFELFTSPLTRSLVCDTTSRQFLARPGPGYLAWDQEPDFVPRGQFSFAIAPTRGNVSGATVPITTDGP